MKIAIVGSFDTGKEALLRKFETDLDFEKYEFYTRAIEKISSIGFPYNDVNSDCSRLALLALNLLYIDKNDNFISNGCLLDNYIYAEIFRNTDYKISDFCIDILRKYWSNYRHKIDLYIFCPTERNDNYKGDEKFLREKIDSLMLTKMYLDLPQQKFLILNGSIEERYTQCKKYIKALGELGNDRTNGKEF